MNTLNQNSFEKLESKNFSIKPILGKLITGVSLMTSVLITDGTNNSANATQETSLKARNEEFLKFENKFYRVIEDGKITEKELALIKTEFKKHNKVLSHESFFIVSNVISNAETTIEKRKKIFFLRNQAKTEKNISLKSIDNKDSLDIRLEKDKEEKEQKRAKELAFLNPEGKKKYIKIEQDLKKAEEWKNKQISASKEEQDRCYKEQDRQCMRTEDNQIGFAENEFNKIKEDLGYKKIGLLKKDSMYRNK